MSSPTISACICDFVSAWRSASSFAIRRALFEAIIRIAIRSSKNLVGERSNGAAKLQNEEYLVDEASGPGQEYWWRSKIERCKICDPLETEREVGFQVSEFSILQR